MSVMYVIDYVGEYINDLDLLQVGVEGILYGQTVLLSCHPMFNKR